MLAESRGSPFCSGLRIVQAAILWCLYGWTLAGRIGLSVALLRDVLFKRGDARPEQEDFLLVRLLDLIDSLDHTRLVLTSHTNYNLPDAPSRALQ